MQLLKVKIGNKIFKVKDCRGISSARGLMFDDLKNKDGALIYSNSIWMPFVKNKLNLIFLDEKMKVVEQQAAVPISLNPKTWKVYKNENAKYCLELKEIKLNVIKGTRIKLFK